MTGRITHLPLAIVALLLSVSVAGAEMHSDKKDEMTSNDMAQKCQAMMEKRQKMQQEMAQTAERLKALQKELATAADEKKQEKLIEIVNILTEHHVAMPEKMQKMMPEMMQHMSEHMADGMMRGMKDSMQKCMMMKEMKNQKMEGDSMRHGEDGAHH